MNQQKTPSWIWYPGDFELWQHMKISLRRQERLVSVPTFWRVDTFYPSVVFKKELNLLVPETVKIYADGKYHILLDNVRLRYAADIIEIPAGYHTLKIAVSNQITIPSILVQGTTVVSDAEWEATCYDGDWHKVGLWNLDSSEVPPSQFQLSLKEVFPVSTKKKSASYFLDFGREIYAHLKLSGISGGGNITVYYGESIEEANSPEHCVLLDHIDIAEIHDEQTFPLKAFRYVTIILNGSIQIDRFSAMYEYLPLDYRGAFRCSDELLNSIWDISRYTLHLNTREFFLDGIKRDGWVWSGDAYQSYLMNYYCFFDKEVCKRTLLALRGKDPVVNHINTIMDYTFYWFIGLYDYYLYTSELEFIRQNYQKMLTLMDFCLSRRNENSMMEGLNGDWIFIDWADMNKKGEVCAEQLLFCRSLEIMEYFSRLLGDTENTVKFAALAEDLHGKILACFWDEKSGALVTSRINGEMFHEVTRHANIFALRFHFVNEEQAKSILNQVLLNNDIPHIKTPYFRFYELEALCEAGKYDYVLDEIRDYWGGMLKLGATTFWEEYDPSLQGTEHYAMYGEPFDKSLCHAWGASPIYLIGKYYLGITPILPGYETYQIKPNLGALKWIQGTVPTPEGDIKLYMDETVIKITSDAHTGYLRFYSSIKPETNVGEINTLENNLYEIIINKHTSEYIIKYRLKN